MVYTIDRALLGILAKPIQNELGITDSQFGMLSAAVFWTYSVCVPFSGFLGDRCNRARIIGIAALIWSLMAIFAGFANDFWSLLFLVSIAICVPQTMYGPSANALIAECHQNTRTVARSLHQAAYYIGWFLSGVVVAVALRWFGSWRAAYFTLGGIGLVLGTAFLLWSERTLPPHNVRGESVNLRHSLRVFLGCKTAMLLSVCYVAQVFVGFGYSTFGPKFVAEKFSISSAQAGIGVMLYHYVAAFIAVLMTGWITDCLIKHFPRSRMVINIVSLMVSLPALWMFGFGMSLSMTWVGATMLGAMLGAIGSNQFAAIFDVVPSCFRAGSVGFLNVIAGIVGSLAPIILGLLSARYGVEGLSVGFAAMTVVEVIAIIAVLTALFTFNNDAIVE